MAKPKYTVRGAFGFDEAENSNAATHDDFGPSLTQQNQAEDADINVIVKRFGVTGLLPQNIRMPLAADFEGIFDYHTAQNLIADAHSAFMQFPAEIRNQFDNDPGRFVDYVSDPKNLDQAVEWGLAPPKPKPPQQAAPATPPAGPAGTGSPPVPAKP